MISANRQIWLRNSHTALSMVGGLLYSLILTSTAIAQLPTATILGVVKDSTGAVVPEATLTAHNAETGQSRTSVTGADGAYRFPALPVGSYEVQLEHPGFRGEVRSGLTLTVGQEAVVNFSLQVGVIEQTVAVTGEVPLVNTTSGVLGGLVSEQRMADLPLNGRNYIDLTLMQPGIQRHDRVNSGSNTGIWFSSNGATPRSNNFLLDGAIMQNIHGSGTASVSGSTMGVEGIREYRIITNSFSAEYGMTMGSQMVIVSKSGTNNFHGSLFEFLRNSALDARNFFDYKTVANERRLPAFTRNNFGGSFGGPIRKDKTFFFAVYEGIRERLGVTTLTTVIPSQAKVDGGSVPQIAAVVKPWLGLFPSPNLPGNQYTFPYSQPTREDYGQMRVDENLSSSDTMFGRYTIHDAGQTRTGSYPELKDDRLSRFQYTTFAENHIFSPSILNTFRFSHSRTNLDLASPTGISGPQFTFVPGLEIGSISPGSGVTAFAPGTPGANHQNIFTWGDDLFYTRGQHSLKFGSLINHYRMSIQNNSGAPGSITFNNLTQFLLGQARSYTAITPDSILARTYHYQTLGFYVQDDWRALSKLTFNLGLRYEFNTQVNEVTGHGSSVRDIRRDTAATLGIPFTNPSKRNLSPRFGFAWDVMGDGRTAVRGGFGLLYDIGNVADALIVGVVGTPPFSSQSMVTNPVALTLPLVFPPESKGKTLRTVDYHLQQPHMLQYNLTLDRQLPSSMSLTLTYAGSRGMNLVTTVEGNPTVPQVLADGRQFWTGNEPRLNPNWGTAEWKTARSNSWYNSLQFSLLKQLRKGLQFQSSYTWSKLIDEAQSQLSNDNNTTSSFSTDPLHRETDRALGTWDAPHNWRFNAIYRLPEIGSAGGALVSIVNGWWMSGILSLQSGLPFTPTLGTNRSRSQVNGGGAGIDRPDFVVGRNNGNSILGGPNQYYDLGAFTIPTAGFLGTAGRNSLRGPGLATLDFSLAKDSKLKFLGEGGKLEFRAEFFNLLNRANFDFPDRTVFTALQNVELPLPTAGSIKATISAARQIQFALKLLF